MVTNTITHKLNIYQLYKKLKFFVKLVIKYLNKDQTITLQKKAVVQIVQKYKNHLNNKIL
jgi:hypothetical protein